MPTWTRRRFLASTAKGVPAVALANAGCETAGMNSGRSADTADPIEPEPDSGSPPPDAPPTVLADTGPELENRWPSSLTHAGPEPLDVAMRVISGRRPTDMVGHALVTYPHPPDDNSPQFVGDGMVVRLDFKSDGIDLVRRPVRTPCYYADVATRGTDDAFEAAGLARMSMTLGSRNSLNTNFLVLGERLLLAFDGGRPWEIDPVTLDAVTPIGAYSEWTSMMPSWISWFRPWPFPVVLSSAHPVRDPDTGDMYTINFGMGAAILQPFTRLVKWNGEGPLTSWNLVDENGANVEIVQSAHQVAITEDFIVFVDVSLRVEWEATFGIDTTRAQLPDTTVWIVPRSELEPSRDTVYCRRVTIPRESTHFLVDYLNPDGHITLYIAHNCATDPSEFIQSDDTNALTGQPVRRDMVGFLASGTDACAMGRYIIDAASGTVVDANIVFDELRLMNTAALYTHKEMDVRDIYENVYWLSLGYSEELRITRMESLYADYPYRKVPLSGLPSETIPGTLYRVYQPTLEIVDTYVFPPGRLPISPQFVPREDSASDTDGYIVVWVCSDDASTEGSTGDELWIFDAANLNQGPLTRLAHPDLNIPFTLHTAWMPDIQPRTADYAVSIRDDIGDAVNRQSASIRAMFETQVYPHFE